MEDRRGTARPRMELPQTIWQRVVLAALLLLAIAGAVRLGQQSMRRAGIDFYQFWALGQAVDQRLVEDIYHSSSRPRLARIFLHSSFRNGSPAQKASARFRKDDLQAASTPFLYTFFYALQSGDYDRDIAVFRSLSIAATLISVLLLCWMLSADPLRGAALLCFLTWAWAPMRDDLSDGNVNQIQLFLLVFFLFLQQAAHRPAQAVAAGAVLGLAALFKPNLGFVFLALVLGWIVDGRWGRLLRCAAGATVGAGLAVFASSLFFDSPRCWLRWLHLLGSLDQHFDVAVRWGNFGGARLWRDALGWDGTLFLNLVSLLILVVVLRASRREEPGECEEAAGEWRRRREFLLAGVGAILPMLAMGLAWPHYLMLALPLLVYLAVGKPGWVYSRTRGGLLVLVVLAVIGSDAGQWLGWYGVRDPYLRALPLAVGCLLFFILAVIELRQATAASPSPTRA